MIIGINGFEAVVPRFGFDKNSNLPNRVGSSEVCFQLLSELAKIDKKNSYVIYLPEKPTADMPEESAKWRYQVIPHVKLWTVFGLTRVLLKKPKLDVFFSPTHYGPLYTPCPEVISILDLSYKHFPKLFTAKDKVQLALWGNYSLRRAKRIVTISQNSKDDIIKEYGVAPDKVAVVHLGVKNSLKPSMSKKELFEKYSVTSPYILFVGTIQPRKNIKKLIEAFSLLKKDNPGLSLIVIGKKGWMYDETLSAPATFGVSSNVVFLDSVTDGELPVFYENAEVFVLPSLYEGFGLPVLEAMRYGCPVVTSNVSSLPEAGGDAALYVNPTDAQDIADKIEKVLKNKSVRENMIKKGYAQVKKFSWEKSAREVLKVLEEAAK